MITQNQIDAMNKRLPPGFLLKVVIHQDGHQVPVLYLDREEDCQSDVG